MAVSSTDATSGAGAAGPPVGRAGSSPYRPSRFGPLIHFLEHQLLRFRSTFRGTVVVGATGPLMYLLGIGIGIGSQIDAEAAELGTGNYLDFVGPGLMAAAAMQLAGSESLWQTGGMLKWEGTYVSITSTPLSIAQLFAGHVMWIGFRVLVASTLFLLVLLPFGVPFGPLAVLAPFAAVLTGMGFAGPISAWTGYVTSKGFADQSFPMILRLFILPMYLFSGAFYPIEQLPEVLTWISRVLPVWHGVQLCRGLILNEGLSLASAAGHVAVLLAYVVVGIYVGTKTFTRALGS